MASRTTPEQPSLFGRRRGPKRGRRPGSGASHLARAPLARRFPVLVTTRMRALPSLRQRKLYRVVEGCLAEGARRDDFRLVEFTVQSNHLHLICEGNDRQALSRGLQGLLIRIARALNRLLGRSGAAFADRYHDRILRTPTEVRNAIAYVLNNARKHAAQGGRRLRRLWVDPCSSAPAFYGAGRLGWLPAPETWLMSGGWRRAGPVDIGEVPRSKRAR